MKHKPPEIRIKTLAEIDMEFFRQNKITLKGTAERPADDEMTDYIDLDFEMPNDRTECDKPQPNKRSRVKSRIIGAFFYTFLIIILAGAFFLVGGQDESGTPRHYAGFSVMRVLTRSMQSEIPQNSLIVTQRVDPDDLQVGDDITFLLDAETVVTHRIVTIYENHEGSNERAFQTQGTENIMPDHRLVIPDNIIGRVVWSNYIIGRVMTLIQDNLIISGTLAAMIIAFIASMRLIFGKKQEKANPNKKRKNITPKRLISE